MRNPKYPVPRQTVWTRKRTKPEKISGRISSKEQVRYTNESLDQGMEIEDSCNYCDNGITASNTEAVSDNEVTRNNNEITISSDNEATTSDNVCVGKTHLQLLKPMELHIMRLKD